VSLLNGSFTAAQFQVGANAGETITVADIDSMETDALGTDGGDKIDTVDVTTAGGATSALTVIDDALSTVTSSRAALGATINRFDQTISNLRVTAESVTATRSRILDADFAAETASLTRLQILQQSGTAVLVQANAIPQNVLSLLR
jgi:flagellin